MSDDARLAWEARRKQHVSFAWRVAAVLLVMGLVIAWLLPSVEPARSVGRRHACTNNLKQIGLALQNYHDQCGSFPPAVVVDANGRPMHSWRILILKFFERPEAATIYDQYKFDEPWDGPNNRRLSLRIPSEYRCPKDQGAPGTTSYLAVVGEETVWPGTTAVSIRNIKDGTSKMIQVVEADDTHINWLEPRDLDFATARQQLSHSQHGKGFNVLFADGSVHFITSDFDPKLWQALLTRDGGENFTWPEGY